ncbi:hypothetical protein RHMOL_Rhmol06G0193800 [Rhododendron molle]|uniref:Uncharacterized protein n=1 Tax=Rhododendron molle TaxID=49168 RepID=A0ACC0NDZ2_RHOML|nr:hypothetical protein RHMOL_Rhmol06G0193800 [Rhododendron molle]
MALQAFMNVVIGVCRLYLFITSTFRPRRPELSLNPDFYQTHINNINRLVRAMASNDVEVVEVEGPTKAKRRSWRKTEEDALMKCMLSEAAERWKAEMASKRVTSPTWRRSYTKCSRGATLRQTPTLTPRSILKRPKACTGSLSGTLKIGKPYLARIRLRGQPPKI